MQVLFDNLTATILAGTVLLILMVMQASLMKSSVERTANYMSKKQSLEFADWLQDDLLNIGRGMERGDRTFEGPAIEVTSDGDTLTEKFTFYQDTLQSKVASNMDDSVRVATAYTLGAPPSSSSPADPAETRTIGGETVKLYRAVRWKREKRKPAASDAPWSNQSWKGAWRKTGQSASLLRHFRIEMRDKDGNLVYPNADDVNENDPSRVQQTHVQFALIPPFYDEESTLDAMHFGSSLLLRK
jgi:hypothetical protein